MEVVRGLNEANSEKLKKEMSKRKKAEIGLERTIKDKAHLRQSLGETGNLGARLNSCERENEELKSKCEGFVSVLSEKEEEILLLRSAVEQNLYCIQKKEFVPQSIRKTLRTIASEAAADSPLKTGEFWSWLDNTSPTNIPKTNEVDLANLESSIASSLPTPTHNNKSTSISLEISNTTFDTFDTFDGNQMKQDIDQLFLNEGERRFVENAPRFAPNPLLLSCFARRRIAQPDAGQQEFPPLQSDVEL